MTRYEYKVCPSPTKGRKAQGVKSPEGRFAKTVEDVLNAHAADGWDYVRSDLLPSEERQGLTSSQTVYRTLLVFRRPVGTADSAADEMIATASTIAEAVAPNESEETTQSAPDMPDTQTQDEHDAPDAPERRPDHS
ncbi:DUF4177 domain-containing protein [Roseovarius aestuarii]|nr:DUF4177 domain-containing protein [Roseovarius aestuarii]